ncbi:MAG: UDP-N-acetylmuramoyl-L-alanyl-D-glutamate--2,6-diaminopimelate ligase [Phycisphaerales bacterium]
MSLGQLIAGLPVHLVRGETMTPIHAVTEDSRTVVPGALFIARAGGRQDGRRFVADAVASGAVAVLSDDPSLDTGAAASLVVDDAPLVAAQVAERFSGEPSRRLTVVGVTGTNGKTTTATLAQQLLNAAGHRCGLIGTVLVDDGVRQSPSALTTPSAIELSRILAEMVSNGCDSVVMEASSHALAQRRTAGLRFRVAVFTNLSGDHLDYHASMDDYADAKAKLFESLGPDDFAIINADDPFSERMVAESKAGRIIRCRLGTIANATHDDASGRALELTAQGARAEFIGPWGRIEAPLPLVGRHNIANALQAVAVAHVVGVSMESITAALATVTAPPGRLEPVTAPDDPFTVLVDYAHTDDALANVLSAVRPIVPDGGRLVAVFGCGGDRDRTKRPRMRRAACANADLVAVTSDNPRTEDPQSIIEDILRDASSDERSRIAIVDPDRRSAINSVIREARDGDVIVIAGKGHEDYQIIGTEKRPFDDRRVAREALERRRGAASPLTATSAGTP